jgi:GT2 family glycosyltransferase
VPKVYIVIVNWNGWQDTIECLESVFRLSYDRYTVIVCDNASADGSLQHIAQWAEGRLSVAPPELQAQTCTAAVGPKPIPYRTIEDGGSSLNPSADERLILVQTGANLGFAGGNNVGLRLALSAGDLDFVWLLNNDTVVDPESLRHMIDTMQQHPGAGMCGSTLIHYRAPRMVQALGGSVYNRWTARGGHLGAGLDRERIPTASWVESRMKYVIGASMLVSRQFLEDVGPMNESYFLYFEEIDWATRAGRRFRLVYSRESLVYHKEGAATGTAHSARDRSELCDFYTARNRLLFTGRYYPYALASVFFFVCLSVLHRFAIGHFRGGTALLRGLSRGVAESLGLGRSLRNNKLMWG